MRTPAAAARLVASVLLFVSTALVAQERGPVVIVDARVLWSEPVLADGGLAYGLEVEEVVHGYVAGSVVVAREIDRRAEPRPEIPYGLGSYLERRMGDRVRVEMRMQEDGFYELVSAHGLVSGNEHELLEAELPGGLLALPDDLEVPWSGHSIPRRVSLAAEDNSFEQQVVELVNEQRWSYDDLHLPPLKRVDLLDNSSEGHSSRMETLNFFSHCDLFNSSLPGTRINAAGYAANYAAENIAAGYTSPDDVMFHNDPVNMVFGWMFSAGHRMNILATGPREIGVGYVFNNSDAANVTIDFDSNCTGDLFNSGPFRHYWTQNFGLRNSVFPVVIEREASSTSNQTVALYVYGAGTATHMRFSNNGTSYSGWETYSSTKSWTLSAGGGDKTVWAQLDFNANGTPDHTASDSIFYDAACSTTTLDDMELDGSPSSYMDCEIIAGPNVQVTGDTTFFASRVRLRNGFTVEDGNEFRVAPLP